MSGTQHQPIFELTRGNIVESVHFGSVAVVDIHGYLLGRHGNPEAVTFLRSAAKPLQALSFLEAGGQEFFGFSPQEIAIMCASHSGSDEHLQVVKELQLKVGVSESELLCGTHLPFDSPSAEQLQKQGMQPTPNHHNCSGKHSGMLGYARMKVMQDPTLKYSQRYIDPSHPIQIEVLSKIAQMSGLPASQIEIGIDGCSLPNFALPMNRTALAFARLCDPHTGGIDEPELVSACQAVVSAMTSHPNLVAGTIRWDTRLMQVAQGRMISKSGAEGYQAIGLMPDALEPGSPAIGIAIKISDGDQRRIVTSAVALEILRQMKALSSADMEELRDFGPVNAIRNWQGIEVGKSQPIFRLF